MKNRQFSNSMILGRWFAWGLFIVWWSWLAVAPLQADRREELATQEPIRITADKLVTDNQTNSAKFSGKVKAVQGQSVLIADDLTLYFDSKRDGKPDSPKLAGASGGIKRIEAKGNVRIEFDNRVAVGEKAVYITDERKLVLEGPGAKVVSGKDEVVGSKITFFRDDGRVAMEGDGKTRVKAIIHSDQRGLN